MAKFFSDREIRALVLFLPLATLVTLAIIFIRPKTTPEMAQRITEELESRKDSIAPHPFDPNTADFDELRLLGLSKYQAVSLLKYRAAGKIFRIPEDLTLCYGIDDSLYRALRPYIRIGRRYAITPQKYRHEQLIAVPLAPTPFRIDTVSARYLRAIGALSKRQAEAFIRWRDLSGIRDMEELRACYVISDSVATALEPYIIFPEQPLRVGKIRIELNTADSATLRSIVGIGEKTIGRILQYRERLGGFLHIEQLSEIPGITERNYEKILQQIYCDSCEIQKIDINFASPNELARHPYLAPRSLRRLLKQRQLKGGWNTVEELVKENILTREEAARLAPYLQFGSLSGHNDR
ncbi:MAG: competence protein ComEA [Rikenellaceae bacterium]|nr:competence protein ComEA [Rikenellaceae bacterium]